MSCLRTGRLEYCHSVAAFFYSGLRRVAVLELVATANARTIVSASDHFHFGKLFVTGIFFGGFARPAPGGCGLRHVDQHKLLTMDGSG
jgi:hypothetical protein